MAKTDRNGHKLSPQQLRAVELFAEGKRDAEVAAELGVARSTVNSWRNWDAHFQAELNRMHNERCRVATVRIAGMQEKALGVVEKKIDEGDLKAAELALKIGKDYGSLVSGVRADTAEEILKQREDLARRQARAAAEEAYTERQFAGLIEMDEKVYKTKLAELLGQEGNKS